MKILVALAISVMSLTAYAGTFEVDKVNLNESSHYNQHNRVTTINTCCPA